MRKRQIFAFLALLIVLASCAGKKKPVLTGEEPVDISDFISFFHDVDLPYSITDTSLTRKSPDSALISTTVFSSFVPDTLLAKQFGKAKPRIFALGKTREKGKETYLFIKAVGATRRVGYVLCFSKDNKFLTGLPLITLTPTEVFTQTYGILDKKFQITTYHEKKGKGSDVIFKRNVFIYNSASNEFTLIVTEPGNELTEDVYNPIDTFSQKNKYTGDYPANKKNFISFRDARKPSEIQFFTHFEKSGGECKGELKGIARFVSAKVAQYKEAGNPCTLEFTFTSSSVSMKEVEGCGTYRDIKCFFDGTFPKKKKKEIKPKTSKSPNKK